MIEEFIRVIVEKIDCTGIDTIVDAGSRDCDQSIEFSTVFREATIHAFECNPDNFRICLNRSKNYPRIQAHQFALCNQDGQLAFNAPNMNKTNNRGRGSLGLYSNKEDRPLCGNVVEVMGIRLDTFRKMSGATQPIDLLWMDVQGSELSVLKGSTKCLHDIRAIHLEACKERSVWEGMPTFEELDAYLQERGFCLEWEDFSLGKTGFIVGNCVYVNKRFC